MHDRQSISLRDATNVVNHSPSVKTELDTDAIIERLLRLRLTKFQLGYCLALRTHVPTEEQRVILKRITDRYPELLGNGNNQNEPNEYNNASNQKQEAVR